MLRKIGVAILVTLPALALALPAQAGAVKLRVTTCLIRSHAYTQAFLQTYVDPINAKKTDVTLDYLGGPEVTPYNQQGLALKRGLVDMILCPSAYYGGLFGEARLPGAQTASIAEIRKNGAWNMMEKAWGEHLNAHILAWVYSGAQKFYTYFTVKPKESSQTGLNLSGMRIRSTGLYNPFLRAMDATTVVMAPGDVYAGLQRGVVQGLAWPWGSIAKYGWQRFIKYRVRPSFFGPSQLLLINLDKWKSLSKEQQHVLDVQVPVLEHKGAQVAAKQSEQDDVKLRKAGVKDLMLKGKVRAAYLKTIYEAKWAQNDKVNHEADYQKLKSLLYNPKELLAAQ